jgi:hypothetical protein
MKDEPARRPNKESKTPSAKMTRKSPRLGGTAYQPELADAYAPSPMLARQRPIHTLPRTARR